MACWSPFSPSAYGPALLEQRDAMPLGAAIQAARLARQQRKVRDGVETFDIELLQASASRWRYFPLANILKDEFARRQQDFTRDFFLAWRCVAANDESDGQELPSTTAPYTRPIRMRRSPSCRSIETWQKADVKYHAHPDGVKELIDQVSQDCKDSKTNFGHDACEKLHRAKRGCKDELGEKCSNEVGGLHPASPEQAFKHAKVDAEDHDQLSAVEICKWLDDIRRGFGSAAAKRFATKFGHEYGPFRSFLRRVLLRIRADWEANTFIQAYELQRLRHKYATSYRKLKENSVGVTMPNERLDEVLVQDVMLGKDYKAVKPAAQKTNLKFDALLKDIHKHLDGIAWVEEAALKSATRALQKIAEDYGRFHLRLIDIVRASGVCRDLQTINQVIKYVKENLCGELEVLRAKSDFDLMSRLSDCVGGYPDCKVPVQDMHKI